MAVSARRKLVRNREEQSQATIPAVKFRACTARCKGRSSSSSRTPAAGPLVSFRKGSRLPFATISVAAMTVHSSADGELTRRKRAPQHQFTLAEDRPNAVARGQPPKWRSLAANLAAGATAGCAVEAALYPIDTVKTRLQMASGGGGIRALFRAGGGKALYAGVLGNLMGVAPSTAVFMAVYEPIKQAVHKNLPSEKRHVLAPLMAGASSGLAASVIRVPTEVVKQRMQSGEFVGAIKAVQGIVGKEGIRGLFAGYGSFLLRDLPFDAIEFVTYEQLKRAYATTLGAKREINPAETAIMGAAAGAVTGILTTPFDVLKTRLMTQGTSGAYNNVTDCAAKIWRQEGWKTFFKGWEPRVLWISIGGCVFFSALEASKTFYHRRLGIPPPKPLH